MFLKTNCFVEHAVTIRRQTNRDALFSRLLGCWFSVFPFKLSDLTCGVPAKPLKESEKKALLTGDTGNFPVRLSEEERARLLKDFGEEDALKSYNEEAGAILKGLSFKSTARSDECGGVASDDVTFSGTLKRITSECIGDDILLRKKNRYSLAPLSMTTVAQKIGIVSSHRSMRAPDAKTLDQSLNGTFGLSSYLDKKELGLIENLSPKLLKISTRCSTMNGVMQQLENLGHAPAEHVEGLNVELFDYQRQAVGWALDREREGGLERFLWTKLPVECTEVIAGRGKTKPMQLYYSPVLDLFKKEAPDDVRGGLIAAQMGLG